MTLPQPSDMNMLYATSWLMYKQSAYRLDAMRCAFTTDNKENASIWYVPLAFFRYEGVRDTHGVVDVQIGMNCLEMTVEATRDTSHKGFNQHKRRGAADNHAVIKPREAIKVQPMIHVKTGYHVHQLRKLTADEMSIIDGVVDKSEKIYGPMTMLDTFSEQQLIDENEYGSTREWVEAVKEACAPPSPENVRANLLELMSELYVDWVTKQTLHRQLFKTAQSRKQPDYAKIVKGLPILCEALIDYMMDPNGVLTDSAQFQGWNEGIPAELDSFMPTKMRSIYGREAEAPAPPPPPGKKEKGKAKAAATSGQAKPKGKGKAQASTGSSSSNPPRGAPSGTSSAQIQSMSVQLHEAREQARRYKRALLDMQADDARWKSRWQKLCSWSSNLLAQLGTAKVMASNSQMREGLQSIIDNNAAPFNLLDVTDLEPKAGNSIASPNQCPPGASQPSPLRGGAEAWPSNVGPHGGAKRAKR